MGELCISLRDAMTENRLVQRSLGRPMIDRRAARKLNDLRDTVGVIS
jgi:hypothetical protein